MGGHRHLVVEAASWGSLLSKAPEVVWCCLYIFNSILTNLNSHELDSPPNACYDQFHTCLFGRWHGPFPEFPSSASGFHGITIHRPRNSVSKNFRTWAFWTVRSSSQQWMNLHDRSQCTLDIETISATASDGFTGSIDPHWSYLVYRGRDWFGGRLSPASLSEFLRWSWSGTVFWRGSFHKEIWNLRDMQAADLFSPWVER